MILRWQQLQEELPIHYDVIETGISKLTQYQDRLATIPAYMLAICKCHTIIFSSLLKGLHFRTVLNPAMKLDWFKQNMPGRVEEMRDLLFEQVFYFQTDN